MNFINDRGPIQDRLGVPRTRTEMEWADNSGYVIPAFRDGNITVDKLLDHADVVLDWYIPSIHAIDFMNFMRLVLGEEPENSNPKAHYFLIDCIFRQENVMPFFRVRNIDFELLDDRILVLCTREFSKSVLVSVMLVLYIAAKGKLPGFGPVKFMLYVSDSMRNGVKTTMETIGSVYRESQYLRSIFEDATTNQDEVSFVRKPVTKNEIALYEEYVVKLGRKESEVPGRMRRTFTIRGIGAASGSRGSRDNLSRPDGCHVEGTIVYTDKGEHPVEDYYKRGNDRYELGYTVKLFGMTEAEIVTSDHRYWVKKQKVTRISKKKYGVSRKYTVEPATWCHAHDLDRTCWIGQQIDMTVAGPKYIQKTSYKITKRNKYGHIIKSEPYLIKYMHPFFELSDWWYYFGYWLGNGHQGKKQLGITIPTHKRSSVGNRIKAFLLNNNKAVHEYDKDGCYQLMFSDKSLAHWLKDYHSKYGMKNIPEWVMTINLEHQKEILRGYIDADGYIDYKNNQIRINSVSYKLLIQIQKIASRLELPTHIRNTKKAGIHTFFNGYTSNTKHQYEIRFRTNIKKVLEYNISDIDRNSNHGKGFAEIEISDGFLWRRVKNIEQNTYDHKFIPIQTPTHVYQTDFGLSHNCIFDDMLGSETDASSDIILDNIESTIEKDVLPALSGNGNFSILIGTPYNKRDPVYKRVEDASWAPIVFPKAERMDDEVTEETFRGVWPDRHSFKQCKKDYMKAKRALDNDNPIPMRGLMQEYYLRISNDEDRLVPSTLIDSQWFSREDVARNSWNYNWYITTDYTSSGSKGSDLSGAALWAVNSNGDMFLMDLVLRKMELEIQYDQTFNMVSQCTGNTRGVEAGIEIDGQQNIHILALKDRMVKKNIYFTIARQKGAKIGQEGIRSRLEKGSKHDRFRNMLPYFQNRKIWFAKELRGSMDMNELMEEISRATYLAFNSKYDDGLDLISMLGVMEITFPNQGEEYSPRKRVGMKRTGINAKIWGKKQEESQEATAYDSYTK